MSLRSVKFLNVSSIKEISVSATDDGLRRRRAMSCCEDNTPCRGERKLTGLDDQEVLPLHCPVADTGHDEAGDGVLYEGVRGRTCKNAQHVGGSVTVDIAAKATPQAHLRPNTGRLTAARILTSSPITAMSLPDSSIAVVLLCREEGTDECRRGVTFITID